MIFNNPIWLLTFVQGLLRIYFPQVGHSELHFPHVSAKPKYSGKYCQPIHRVVFYVYLLKKDDHLIKILDLQIYKAIY